MVYIWQIASYWLMLGSSREGGMPQMISKLARANNSDRRVLRDHLILYKVVLSLGKVKIGPSNIYGPLAGAVVLQLTCGAHYKTSEWKLLPVERVLCRRQSLNIPKLCNWKRRWNWPLCLSPGETVKAFFTKVMWSIRKKRRFRINPEKSQTLSQQVKKW